MARPVVNTDLPPSRRWPKRKIKFYGGPMHGQTMNHIPPFDDPLIYDGETYHLVIEHNLYVHESRRPQVA